MPPTNTNYQGDLWFVPVEYLGSPGWCYVDAGRAYVRFEALRVDEEVAHGATLRVSRRDRGSLDRMRLESLVAKVPHLQVEIIEID